MNKSLNTEERIQLTGKSLLDAAPTLEDSWLDHLVSLALSDEKTRIRTLRFIDVLPCLEDNSSLSQHLKSYFGDLELPEDFPLRELTQWGLQHSDHPLLSSISAPISRAAVNALSHRFMGGETAHEAVETIRLLQSSGFNTSLDILGEATISEAEASQYQQAYLKLIPEVAAFYMTDTDHKLSLSDNPAPVLNLSLKLSSLYSQINVCDPAGSQQAILKRLYPIIECAREFNAFIMIDMEQYDYKPIVMGCFLQLLKDPSLRHWPHFGLAIQAYLRDTCDDLRIITDCVIKRGTPVTIRLVRGAYWDYETIIAKQKNWPLPVWQYKQNTDANYERCLAWLLQHHDSVRPAIATHNTRSVAAAMVMAEQQNLNNCDYEFQMLYGMAEPLKYSLLKNNQSVRVYVPWGKTLPGMAYLVRRLLENSSGQSLLQQTVDSAGNHTVDYRKLLQKPEFVDDAANNKAIETESGGFQNTATLRFTDDVERSEFQHAIESEIQKYGEHYPLLIDGKHISTVKKITSFNPACPRNIIGKTSSADLHLASQAVDAATKAFNEWQQTTVSERSTLLRSIATRLNARRFEFAALEVLEAGKNWHEADADVCEAIDFLRYYADQIERIPETHVCVPGEDNSISWQGRGPGLVIAPWNFPLAILTGMLSAMLVTGNTVIVKPSSETPVIAARFIELIHRCNLPKGVVNLCSGSGETIGHYLVMHANIHTIAFTGSEAVGTNLIRQATEIQPNQHHIKRVIAEMGGKNAIIIDNDADLDVAVTATIESAFGYQGQKCSACSRVIVLESIYKKFCSRLVEATQSLQMGPPINPRFSIGPVISQTAQHRIFKTISATRKQATVLLDENIYNSGANHTETGFYISPVIFSDVHPNMPVAQNEIFGPVLSVIKAKSFNEAINIANHSRYGLTGGIFSRNPVNLGYARTAFKAGNLYLNRTITGALISRQPFGGLGMSGNGFKAGGEQYLYQFMNARCITENTLRRGFAPDKSILLNEPEQGANHVSSES